jgi:hypothetical protein
MNKIHKQLSDPPRRRSPIINQRQRTAREPRQGNIGIGARMSWPAQAIDLPAGSVATYRVNVLLENLWRPLATALQPPAGSSHATEAVDILDLLIDLAAPALAMRNLSAYVREHRGVYQQLGLSWLAFQNVLEYQYYATTVWGELNPSVLLTELDRLVSVAYEARAPLRHIPNGLFWPVMRAFFSAVDRGAWVSPGTWHAVATVPERFTLLEMFVIAHTGDTFADTPSVNSLDKPGNQSDWWLCHKCGRAFQEGEQIAVHNRRYCPYGCEAEIALGTWAWGTRHGSAGTASAVPQKWQVYDLQYEP